MSTLTDFFKDYKNNLEQQVPLLLQREVGMLALAYIRTRIATNGTRADGGKFSPYSTATTLVGASSFVTKKAANKIFGSKKSRKAADWVTYKGHHLVLLKGGYAEIRKLEGRQVGHKDFERTSELWKSIHVLGVLKKGEGKFRCSIGTTNPLSLKKLEGLQKQENAPILALSKKELDELTQYLIKRLAQ
jgi:hypothetical protein